MWIGSKHVNITAPNTHQHRFKLTTNKWIFTSIAAMACYANVIPFLFYRNNFDWQINVKQAQTHTIESWSIIQWKIKWIDKIIGNKKFVRIQQRWVCVLRLFSFWFLLYLLNNKQHTKNVDCINWFLFQRENLINWWESQPTFHVNFSSKHEQDHANTQHKYQM